MRVRHEVLHLCLSLSRRHGRNYLVAAFGQDRSGGHHVATLAALVYGPEVCLDPVLLQVVVISSRHVSHTQTICRSPVRERGNHTLKGGRKFVGSHFLPLILFCLFPCKEKVDSIRAFISWVRVPIIRGYNFSYCVNKTTVVTRRTFSTDNDSPFSAALSPCVSSDSGGISRYFYFCNYSIV